MRAIVIDSYGDPSAVLKVSDIDRPALKRGQVLVKVAAAPVHPADIAFVNGWYGIKRPVPTVPGLEGCGTVVEANAGLYGRWLVGKRVAFAGTTDGTGTWAEYAVSDAMLCLPLPARVSDVAGAFLLVNPLTACSFMAITRKGGHRSIIQTAASSQLGHMVLRLAKLRGIAVINVVRREEQAEALRAAGATHVLCSADTNFNPKLAQLAHRLNARLAFDAVGGQLSSIVAGAMPQDGKVVLYGGLSGQDARLTIADTLFKGKSLEGYWAPLYIRKAGMAGLLPIVTTIRKHADTIFRTTVLKTLPLEGYAEAITLQRERASEGKIVFVP